MCRTCSKTAQMKCNNKRIIKNDRKISAIVDESATVSVQTTWIIYLTVQVDANGDPELIGRSTCSHYL